MADQDKLQQQLGDIGLRYLKRTLGEIGALRNLLQNLRNGEPGTLKEIEHLSHKIHGSGAMFGFDELSRHARELELACAADAQATPELHARLQRYIDNLAVAVETTAAQRNVQR